MWCNTPGQLHDNYYHYDKGSFLLLRVLPIVICHDDESREMAQ